MDPKDQKGTDPQSDAAQKPTNEGGDKGENKNFDFAKEQERLEGLKPKTSKYTPQEKAVFSFKQIADQIRKDGGDPMKILGGSNEGGVEGKKEGYSIDEFRAIAAEEAQKASKGVIEIEINSRISKMAKGIDERKLVKHVLDNVIQQTGDLDEDIENAYIIANKHRIKGAFNELARGKDSEEGKTTEGTGSGQKKPEKSTPRFTAAEEAFAKRKGLVWDEESGKFISKAKQAYDKKHAR